LIPTRKVEICAKYVAFHRICDLSQRNFSLTALGVKRPLSQPAYYELYYEQMIY